MSKPPTNTTLEPLYYVVQEYIPWTTPYRSSYVHGKMGTNDPIKNLTLTS